MATPLADEEKSGLSIFAADVGSGLGEGLRSTGGSMCWLEVVFVGVLAKEALLGVVGSFDGDNDRARSSVHVNKSGPICNRAVNTGHDASPALRACRSLRPCAISSSNLRVRSSSSLSRLIFRLAIRSRKSSTVSEPSLGVAIVCEPNNKFVGIVSQLWYSQVPVNRERKMPATTRKSQQVSSKADVPQF